MPPWSGAGLFLNVTSIIPWSDVPSPAHLLLRSLTHHCDGTVTSLQPALSISGTPTTLLWSQGQRFRCTQGSLSKTRVGATRRCSINNSVCAHTGRSACVHTGRSACMHTGRSACAHTGCTHRTGMLLGMQSRDHGCSRSSAPSLCHKAASVSVATLNLLFHWTTWVT